MVRRLATHVLVASLLAAPGTLVLMTGAGAAQETPTTIIVRDFACDSETPADVWNDCEAIWGITYTVEADGAETSQSPVTTERDMGLGHGAGVEVPSDATSVSLTPTGGIPDGYMAAEGYNPFSASIADLPEVGFGGEATGPGITMIYVSSASPEEPDDEDPNGAGQDEEPTTLPNTGIGSTTIDSNASLSMSLLVGSMVLTMGGIWIRWRLSSR